MSTSNPTETPAVWQATLHPDRVTGPLWQAARTSVETINLALNALEVADLAVPPEAPKALFALGFGGVRDPAERKAAYTNWLLGKGFQEITRGVRQTLEEAFLYCELFKTVGGSVLWGDVLAIRKKAGKKDFGALLRGVSQRLHTPLIFAQEFQSLQDVRNCLEHRAGIVGTEDVGDDGRLKLVLPRLAPFVVENGVEVEVQQGHRVSRGTVIGMKRVNRTREYVEGQRIVFTAEEFQEIAFSCVYFANDIATKLPTPVAALPRGEAL